MAEGETHRELVRRLHEKLLEETGPSWSIFVDRGAFGERAGIAPAIGGHRPDIFAIDHTSRRTYIGEAKTSDDIDRAHTHRQLKDYFEYLAAEAGEGKLWIAVPLLAGGTAHRVCRHVRTRLGLARIPFSITGWLIGPKPFVQTWHG